MLIAMQPFSPNPIHQGGLNNAEMKTWSDGKDC